MAKMLLALVAGVFLVVTVVLLAVPFTHSYEVPPGCCPSGAIWAGPGPEPPRPPPPTAYPVDCGTAMSGGPADFSPNSFRLFSEPCEEPIRTRRIAGSVSLLLGAGAVAATIVLGRRSTGQEQSARLDSADSVEG